DDVGSAVEVVPADLRHRLWLQASFDALCGLGHDPDLTLANEDQHFRIDELVDWFRRIKESMAYLELTLDTLLSFVILPPDEVPIFIKLMQERLGLASVNDSLAPHL